MAARPRPLDRLHRDRLACDPCGHRIGPVDSAGEDPAALDSLTDDQVRHRWPHLAQELAYHDAVCLPRGWPTPEERERWGVPG